MKTPFSGRVPSIAAGRSPFSQRKTDRLADRLNALHSRGEFNGTVLVAERGRIRFQRHYGFADIEAGVPLSDHASFALASVSKQFTGMGITLLAQEGKLTLDDAMARHIPELAGYDAITIRQLLHHTSGLPDYMELADDYWDPRHVLTTRDLIALFRKHQPAPYFAPGDQFEYGNTGYALLGEIIARASGTSYPEFMARRIFLPLGMRDSAAFNLSSEKCPLRSRVFGFRQGFGKVISCDLNHLDGTFGDGGIYASADDLVRWDIALREGTLIPNELYAEAYQSGELNNGERTGYGYGWEIDPPDVVWHLGEWQGFTSYVRRDLRKQTMLVVLSNLGPSDRVETVSSELRAFVESV